MNKNELIDAIADSTGHDKKVVGDVVDAFESTLAKELSNGNKVALPGFVTFERVHRAERTGRNPATGETMTVPAADVPKAKFGKKFRDTVG